MAHQRPCRICKKWFRPDARAGARQRTCGSPSCQRERHCRACAAWRGRNPDYDQEERLRRRLYREMKPIVSDPLVVPPMERLDRAAARDAVGLEVSVVLEVTAQLLWDGVRDAVAAQRRGSGPVGR
jgi:hypothetical protein